MARHLLVVRTNPQEGKEEEFNRWYSETHIREVVGIPGFASAQRFRQAEAQIQEPDEFGYLALYEIETDDLAATLNALQDAVPSLDMGDSLDPVLSVLAFTPITGRVVAGGES
ncbi:MAG: hypothetical protein ACE5EF_06260 [Dehalococcoidia bacterium]